MASVQDILKGPHKLVNGEYRPDPNFKVSDYPRYKYKITFDKKAGADVATTILVNDPDDEAVQAEKGFKYNFPDRREDQNKKPE